MSKTQAKRQVRQEECRKREAANDNQPSRRVVVHLSPHVPISLVETEVFDILIGPLIEFAANDNERHNPHPDAIRGPPARVLADAQPFQRKEAI